MHAPQATPPLHLLRIHELGLGNIPTLCDLALPPDSHSEMQTGGEAEATSLLGSFLANRGRGYQRAMSSPLSAWDTCSRLSAHFAWGTLSLRQTY